VTAAGHQVDEANLVDLAQIRTLDDVAGGDDALDVELEPANIGNVEFGDQPVSRAAVRAITDQPGAVGELDDRANLMEPRRLRVPANACETGEVGVVGLVAEGQRARRRAQAGPDVSRIVLVVGGAGQLNLLGRAAVEFDLE
jgi:hypothetical protein